MKRKAGGKGEKTHASFIAVEILLQKANQEEGGGRSVYVRIERIAKGSKVKEQETGEDEQA
jgi:hypothetical protein